MRPVYQEIILPNLAYIGGPGEIAYWLQLKDVFEIHQVYFPILWLRNSVMLLSDSIQNRIEKAGLDILDFFQSSESLNKQIVDRESGFDATLLIKTIDSTIQQMIDELNKLDNQLASKVIKHKNEQIAFYNKLKKEINEKVKEKSETEIVKIMKLKESLFPNNTPQERYANILQFSTDMKLIESLYNNINLSGGLTIFRV